MIFPFLSDIINYVITILVYAILIRAILSFVPQLISSNNKIVSLLYDVTDPILKPFQRFQVGGPGMAIDFSPFIAIFVLKLLGALAVRLLGLFF